MARPQWISEKEAWEGQSLTLVGRNLQGDEFGAPNQTKVRLNGPAAVELTVTSSNAYAVEFTIDQAGSAAAVPLGTYDVEVSNDNGGHWAKPSSGQQLTIVPGNDATDDPLDLGVAWARNFNWTKVKGPTPSGGDDTSALQQAIDDLGPNGGRLVLRGLYKVTTLQLPPKVVLDGGDWDKTTLMYIGRSDTKVSMIESRAVNGEYQGKVGIANLRITADKNNKDGIDVFYRPDTFIRLGQPWDDIVCCDTTKRTAEQMFVKNVKLDYDYQVPEVMKWVDVEGQPGVKEWKRVYDTDRRGYPMMTIGKERLLVQNSYFDAFSGYNHNYVNQYSMITDNYFQYAHGVFIDSAEYTVAKGNTLVGDQRLNSEKHGLSIRTNAYVTGNFISGMRSVRDSTLVAGDQDSANDGEAIMSEAPGGYFNYGTVTGQSPSNAMTVAPAKPFPADASKAIIPMYSYPAVLIVEGKGVGQLRKITGITGNTIGVTPNWDVEPDQTSKWTMITPNDNVTVYNNSITDNDKGIWLFGNAYDSVVADNWSTNSEGVFIWSVNNFAYQVDPVTKQKTNDIRLAAFSPNYYNRVEGNILTGVSPLSANAHIGIVSERFVDDPNVSSHPTKGPYFGIQSFANEFKDNEIYGNGQTPPTNYPHGNESPTYDAGLYLSAAHIGYNDDDPANGIVTPNGDSTNTIYENNYVESKKYLFQGLLKAYGLTLRNNAFYNIDPNDWHYNLGTQNYDIVGNGLSPTDRSPTPPPVQPGPPTAPPVIAPPDSELTEIEGAPFGATPSWTAGTGFEKAFDNDPATYFDYMHPDGGYTGIDLGAGNEKRVAQIKFHPRIGQEGRMLNGVFQGSNTSETDGFVDLTNPIGSVAAGWNTIAVNDQTTAYRYLRYLAPNNAYGNVSEIEFYTPTETSGGSGYLDRADWTGDGSGSGFGYALDGIASTRWSTNAFQEPEQLPDRPAQIYVLDMKSPKTFNQIKLDTTDSPYDYPRGYKVYVSDDGQTWGAPIAEGMGTEAVTIVRFPDQTKQYIKLEQTGESTNTYWSIHELNVGWFPGGVLDRTGWDESASMNDAAAGAATDGDPATRWDTNWPQGTQSEQSYRIDFQTPQTFYKIVLDTSGSPADYPRQYEVRVSSDGNDWSTVIARGYGNGAVTEITFPVRTTQHLKIVQTGTDNTFYWSIHELNLHY